MQKNAVWTHQNTKTLVYLATFCAIAIVCKVLSGFMTFGSVRITFVYVPYFLAGVMLGPIYGMGVGVIADLLGFLSGAIAGSFNPFITLTNGLYGFFMGLVFHGGKKLFAPKSRSQQTLVLTVIGTLVCAFVVCLGAGSYLNYLIGTNGVNSWADYFARVISRIPQATMVILQGFSIAPIYTAVCAKSFRAAPKSIGVPTK